MLKSGLIPFILTLMLITMSASNRKSTLEIDQVNKLTEKIKVAAHRGSHSNFPENSIAAVEESIRQGVDIVEIDIRETKDHIPVLMHDKSLLRTTTGEKLLIDSNYSDLQNYWLLFNKEPSKYKIPTLEEVLQLSKNRITLNLDFKLDDLEAMKRTYDLVAKYEMESSVIFTVKELQFLPNLYQLNPGIQIMPVAFSNRKIKKVLKNDFIDIIQLYHRPYWKYNIRKFEERNIKIWVNSLNKYDEMEMRGGKGFEKLLSIKKVDIIQTDYPEELIAFLKERGLNN